MTCSSSGNYDIKGDFGHRHTVISMGNTGLVSSHEYSLLSAHEVYVNGETLRLVRLRNPWGEKEWNGDWSDHSPLWTP